MQISSTQLKAAKRLPANATPPTISTEQRNEPTDSFAFSEKRLSAKEMIQTGTIGVVGGLIGALPGVGTLSGAAAMVANDGDELGALIGLASAVTNAVATVAVFGAGQSPYWLAVPGVTGAISWSGMAYNSATS